MQEMRIRMYDMYHYTAAFLVRCCYQAFLNFLKFSLKFIVPDQVGDDDPDQVGDDDPDQVGDDDPDQVGGDDPDQVGDDWPLRHPRT